jgi:hypothetical protein
VIDAYVLERLGEVKREGINYRAVPIMRSLRRCLDAIQRGGLTGRPPVKLPPKHPYVITTGSFR